MLVSGGEPGPHFEQRPWGLIMWFRRGVSALILTGIFAGPVANADTAGVTDVSVDLSPLAAVLKTEAKGMQSVSANTLNQLTSEPEPDVRALTGYTKSSLASMKPATGGKQWQCMAEALYFEARGEAVLGQFAVAEVIMNRVKSSRYPDTVCGVIRQGTGQRHRCQFSFYCDGRAEVINEPRAYEQVGKVARLAMDGDVPTLTRGATHYHTRAVSPNWSKVFEKTATIGYHHFYIEHLRLVRR